MLLWKTSIRYKANTERTISKLSTPRSESGVGRWRQIKGWAAVLIAAGLLCLVPATRVEASTIYSFDGITNNTSGNPEIAEAQLTIEVSSPAAGKVRFDFANSGPVGSTITQIAFDDAMPLFLLPTSTAANVDNSDAGVTFELDGSPGTLPGGSTLSETFTFARKSMGGLGNGVDPGESVGILLMLAALKDLDDVLDGLADSSLRIGMHVQRLDGPLGDSSETLVNLPDPNSIRGGAAPEPSTAILVGIGLVMFGLKRRRRRK